MKYEKAAARIVRIDNTDVVMASNDCPNKNFQNEPCGKPSHTACPSVPGLAAVADTNGTDWLE